MSGSILTPLLKARLQNRRLQGIGKRKYGVLANNRVYLLPSLQKASKRVYMSAQFPIIKYIVSKTK